MFGVEMPELDRSVLEALRQPLEDGVVTAVCDLRYYDCLKNARTPRDRSACWGWAYMRYCFRTIISYGGGG